MDIDARDRLILALDNVPDNDNAVLQTFVEESVPDAVRIVKIGWPWFMRYEIPAAVRALKSLKKRVFLDAKFADVESVARKLVGRCEELGVDFVTINHGWSTVEAAVKAKSRNSPLKIFTITVLTSETATTEAVVGRAKQAQDIGCDGVIASGREAAAIRGVAGRGFLIATPGIRPAGSAADDQKRTATPHEAVSNGADYLVVGRPITSARDPRRAALDIIEEMRLAFNAR